MCTCLLWGLTPLAVGIVVEGLIVVDETLAEAEEVAVSKRAKAWGEGQGRSARVSAERYCDAEEQEEEGHLLGSAQGFYRPCKCVHYWCL